MLRSVELLSGRITRITNPPCTSVQWWKTGSVVRRRTGSWEPVLRLETEDNGPSHPGTREGGALAFPDCFADLLGPGWPASDDLGWRLVTRWPGGRGRRLKGDMRLAWGWEMDERDAAARRSNCARYTGSDSRLKQKCIVKSQVEIKSKIHQMSIKWNENLKGKSWTCLNCQWAVQCIVQLAPDWVNET